MNFKFHWTDIGFFFFGLLAIYLAMRDGSIGPIVVLFTAMLFIYHRIGLLEGRSLSLEGQTSSLGKRMGSLEGRLTSLEKEFPKQIRGIIREELK